MLLCIALVAALGVNAFAVELTNREKADEAAAKKAAEVAKKETVTKRADMLEAIEELYLNYEKEWGELKKDTSATAADFTLLSKDYEAKLAAIKASDTKTAEMLQNEAKASTTWIAKDGTNVTMPSWDPFVWSPNPMHNDYKYWDAVIDAIRYDAGQWYDSTIAAHQADVDLYTKLADKEDAAAAEAAAKAAADAKIKEAAEKLEKAALKAAQAAVKDPKNSAEWMAYWAAYNKVYADKNLADAKDSADAAKKTVQTAQKAAVAQAQLAVENAQVVAYNNMATEINKAVTEYISGVNDALVEFYAGLYEFFLFGDL